MRINTISLTHKNTALKIALTSNYMYSGVETVLASEVLVISGTDRNKLRMAR